MIENIRLSFQGIWSHKMRSFLTMLGIIIGIAAIISIVSTIKGTNEQIKQNLIGSGNNVTRVQLYQQEYDSPYQMEFEGIPEGVLPVSSDVYNAILDLPDVVSAAAYNRRTSYDSSFYYSNTEISGCEIYGIDNAYFSTCSYSVKKGRAFVPRDFTDFRHVAILDTSAAQMFFQGADPIGKTIEFKSTALVVVGVVEPDRKFEPIINTIEDYYTYAGAQTGGSVFVPENIWPSFFAYDEPQEIAVQVSHTEAMSTVGEAVAALLNSQVTSERVLYKSEDTLKQAQERYRRYEHHAGVCYRAHQGNRPKKGHRRKKRPDFVAVFDGSRCAHRLGRAFGRGRGYWHGRAYLPSYLCPGVYQHPLHHPGGDFLHGYRHPFRAAAFCKGFKLKPH